MSAAVRAEVAEVLGELDVLADRLCRLNFEMHSTEELLRAREALQRVVRKLRVPGHAMVNQLSATATPAEVGGTVAQGLANWLRITKSEADQCVAEAAALSPRRSLTGAPLGPELELTAAAERQGLIDSGHISVIRRFFAKLPDEVDAATRAKAEADLVLCASGFRPDELAEYARVYKDCLKPNGDFRDQPQKAAHRGITIGPQRADGMSKISGLITPECRAAFEPVLAKLGAPGMCNPADDAPVVRGRAPAEAVDRDPRPASQRHHDALHTVLRSALMSGELGEHHGLPTSIVVTTTLTELEAGSGCGLTAGGTLLSMAEVIRLASHAHHYLAIFDKDKTLALYHGKRLANPAQRLVLLAKEGGCTAPGCRVPGYWTQVHHVASWMETRRTHIDELTLACPPHNGRVERYKYLTCKNNRGDTEWIPPAHLDHGQPRTNCMHHRQKRIQTDPANPEDEPG